MSRLHAGEKLAQRQWVETEILRALDRLAIHEVLDSISLTHAVWLAAETRSRRSIADSVSSVLGSMKTRRLVVEPRRGRWKATDAGRAALQMVDEPEGAA
jgi:hypothetical protein